MTSREPADPPRIGGGRRWLFALALFAFAAWAIGLGVLAFTTAENPRAVLVVPR
jgi:hypothetical protein